jgi:hypothetical protein
MGPRLGVSLRRLREGRAVMKGGGMNVDNSGRCRPPMSERKDQAMTDDFKPMAKREADELMAMFADGILPVLAAMPPERAKRIRTAIDGGLFDVVRFTEDEQTIDVRGFGELSVTRVELPKTERPN